MKAFLDRYYRYIRPLRFLYGGIKDRHARMKCSQRTEEWKAKGFRGAKLDICGGRNPLDPKEYLNVDIVQFPEVDIAFDICKRFPFDDGVITEIFSAATLEHLRKPNVDHVLDEFARVLAPGGLIRISTPDMEAIAKAIIEKKDLQKIAQFMFGKFKSDETELYDLHKWMYPADAMIEELKKRRFERVEQIPMEGRLAELHTPEYNYLIQGYKAVS